MAQKFTTPITIRDLTSASSDSIAVSLSGDTNDRFKIEAGGRIVWGTGSAAGDVNLYRDSANVLKTDDVFEAPSGVVTLAAPGVPSAALPDGALAIDTNTDVFYVRSGGAWVQVSGTGGVTDHGALSGLGDDDHTIYLLADGTRAAAELTVSGDLTVDTSTLYVDSTNNRVGVGTTTPSTTLDVNGTLTATSFVGPLTGNSDTASALATARTISLGGDLSGSALFDGSSDITISATVSLDSVALGADTTGDYVQNLTAGTGVTLTNNSGEGATPTVAIGQDVGTTANVTFNDLTVSGNLTVNGNTTTVDTATLSVEDPLIILASGNSTTDSVDIGFYGLYDTSGAQDLYAGLFRDASDGKFRLFVDSQTAPTTTVDTAATGYTVASLVANLEGNVTGNVTGTVSDISNHGIGDLSDVNLTIVSPSTGDILYYDGAEWVAQPWTVSNSSDVTITSATAGDYLKWNGSSWVNDAIDLGTDTVGDYVQNLTAGTGVTLTNNTGEGATPTVAIGQDVGTTANVTFNTVNADLTGNVTGNSSTASALQTPRTISLGGDLSGSASFDGSADITISATVSLDSVALGADTTGDYVESLVAGTGVTLSNNTGEGATPTVAIGQDVGTTASVTFASVSADLTGDVTGNVSGDLTGDVYAADGISKILENGTDGTNATFTGDVTGDLSGNATTADALSTPRTIALSGDVAGSASFDGSANVSISATIQADSVALGTDTTGDYVQSLVAGTGVTLSNNTGESATPTVEIGQSVGTTDNVTFNTVTGTSGLVTLTSSGTPSTSIADGAMAVDTLNDIFYFRSGGSWREVSSVTALSLLTDVSIPSPSDGDVLQYDNSSGEWVSASAPSGLPTGGSAGQVLSKVDGTNYNTQWVDIISGDGGTPSTPIRVLVAMDAGGV